MKISSDSAGVRYPPPFVLLLCIGLSFLLQAYLPLPWIAGALRWAIGFMLLTDGIALTLWSILLFKKHKTHLAPWAPSVLVIREGPYRFSRNPIYLGFTLVALSTAFLGNTLWGFAAALAFLAFSHFYVIAREERYLSSKFGAEYESFKSATRRWL